MGLNDEAVHAEQTGPWDHHFLMPWSDDGFFHALQQFPEDDALRLVYADFIEERCDEGSAAHAELIRIQIELAAQHSANERTGQLVARQDELIATWQRVWLREWADALTGCSFRRGLVEAIRTDAASFLEHAADWFREWPTLTVAKITDVGDQLPQLAASPWLAHLRGLDLSDNGLNATVLAPLTRSRFICLLQALDLSGNPIGASGAELLAKSPLAHELRELHLRGCELWHHGLLTLISTRPAWRRLDLSSNGINRLGLIRLVDSPLMRNLEAIDLSANPLREHGASVLADSSNAACLVDLGLACTSTGDADVSALAASPNLPRLRSLDLRGHDCRPIVDRDGEDQGGIGSLSRSPLLSQLRRLLLSNSYSATSNNWTADVLGIARPPQQREVARDWWMSRQLRKSRYLMPSQLIECDLDELWWLGHTSERERLPPSQYELAYAPDEILELLSRMDKTHSTVLRLRYGVDDERSRTRREISEQLGWSQERVREIESEALNRFRDLQKRQGCRQQ